MDVLTDQQLLRSYAEQRSEPAFAELVGRHVDLVYSAALRMMRDGDASKDVAQEVFVALARNAGQLAGHPVLAGWLHQTTRNIAANTVRAHARRGIREQEAATMSEILASQTEAGWEQIAPQLDDALGELSPEDRDAVLLRYFQRKSAQEMAQSLGISAEAAQKRVNRAVERLREFFAKRGVAVGASGLAAAVSANAVHAAPAGLAASISTTAGAATAAFTASTLTKAIVMTTLQKTIAAAALAVVAGMGIYEARQAAQFRENAETLRKQQTTLLAQVRQMQKERDDATNRLASLADVAARNRSNDLELLRLRRQVGQLHNAANDPAQAEAKLWLNRLAQLKQRLQQTPGMGIPEFSLLKESDWLDAVKNNSLDTDLQYRQAFSTLRNIAEGEFASELSTALGKYVTQNGGQFPTDLAQLKPFFDSPPDDAMLQRWEIVPASTVPGVGVGSQVITEVSAVDDLLDQRNAIGTNGSGAMGFLDSEVRNILQPVYAAYAGANNGNWQGFSNSMLLPYAQTPEQQAAVQKLVEQSALRQQ